MDWRPGVVKYLRDRYKAPEFEVLVVSDVVHVAHVLVRRKITCIDAEYAIIKEEETPNEKGNSEQASEAGAPEPSDTVCNAEYKGGETE